MPQRLSAVKITEVPAGLDDHFFHIALERPHGEVNIWLDGYKLGRDESLSTAGQVGGWLAILCRQHGLVFVVDGDGRA